MASVTLRPPSTPYAHWIETGWVVGEPFALVGERTPVVQCGVQRHYSDQAPRICNTVVFRSEFIECNVD
jgi:hypothetical protein